ncbi:MULTISPECIES: hypothetical protein [unclassified Leptolyngbya]|uniref:hypothetical protein n=1 Tax=unclassified Leptolyngbya TaxID=2650499 RepID=UPI0016832039|nr:MULTISPECIES: hypothetical protein [unclassified Leptolyngbya]MBD1912398.1 hypothetical protein [Leptolyngbya sp. FACHB-8]MBD2154802.1 hypothetical protein [Leptolyngbya sp. FACHB-16]
MPATTAAVNLTELQSTTRILLTLWELGGVGGEVRRGELTKRVVQKGKKSTDYKNVLDQLTDDGAIAVTKNTISLSDKGVELLSQNLKNADFAFSSQVGAKTANALLKWVREMGTTSPSTNGKVHTNGKVVEDAIASYEAFKPVVLEVYDRLNRDFNHEDLVPIYRIRREIGEQVSRSQFDEWLLEMQSGDILQLIGGEMPDITADKAQDSIKTALGGVRYYAKRL